MKEHDVMFLFHLATSEIKEMKYELLHFYT